MERYYWGSYEVHAHVIPLGTFHRLKLVSAHGNTLSLGERIRCADDLGEEIAHFTFGPLWPKALQGFHSGARVDFGAIRVHQSEGITLRKFFLEKKLPWQDIAGYDITEKHFSLHRFNHRYTGKGASERVANVHVLRALLNTVLQPVWRS